MRRQYRTFGSKCRKWQVMGLCAVLGLAACDEAGNFSLDSASSADGKAGTSATTPAEATEFVEKEVESPDVFFAQETGLWDGRPSLGGVWVAHPDVAQPERVRIKNNTNGKFVVGALFKCVRCPANHRLQLSSDAAQAIGVLAGAPVELEVVALRKEEIPVAPPPAPEPVVIEPEPVVAAPEPVAIEPAADTAPEPTVIEETSLDPIAAAGAAIETAPLTPVEAEVAAAEPTASPAATSTLPETRLENPYVQVGTFGVEANAEQASNQMNRIGLVPTVREEGSNAQPSWRVVVGPASSRDELQKTLKQVKDAGFSDAYVVPN